MQTASELKNATTQLRRTETALRRIAAGCDVPVKDKDALLHAAGIVAALASARAKKQKAAARQEKERDAFLAKATAEARDIIATWPLSTTLDKVALIIASRSSGEASLRRDLAHPDFTWHLRYWLEEAPRNIPGSVAWRAFEQKKSVAELMAAARERLETIRTSPATIALAKRCQAQLDAERIAQPGH